MNKIGNQYLKQVKSHLTCPAALKKTFLEQIQGDVEEFLETNPDATLEILTVRFGEPNQMACSYLDGLDGNELQKQIKKAKTVKRTILFTCLGLLLAVLVAITILVIASLSSKSTVITYTVSEDQLVITEIEEIPTNEAITSDSTTSTNSVVQQSEITEVIEEIVES